jgi:hypothetical protein
MTTRAPLDSFESALLSELRDVVAERSAAQPRRRKPVLVAAAAAATVAASVGAIVFGLGTGGPAPASAYSVSTEDDGDIVVQIRRLDDADGLELALAEHGITAKVSYGGDTNDCVQFPVNDDEGPCSVPDEELNTEPDLSGPPVEALPVDPGDAGVDPCGFGENAPSTLRRVDDGWTLTIPADSPLHDGVDLHIITQGGSTDAMLSTMFTKGDVACGASEFVN